MIKKPMVRYVIVGGSVYGLELAIISTATNLGASNLWAVSWAFWVGLVVSFLLQKMFMFGDKRLQQRIVLLQLAAVTALVLFNFGFTLLVTDALTGIVPAAAARTLALLTTTVWNFYLYRTRIFRVMPTPDRSGVL